MEETEWSNQERAAFERLTRSFSNNVILEEKVVNTLLINKLIRRQAKIKPWHYLSGFAASLIIFIGGYLAGHQAQGTGAAVFPSNYILLLSEDENFKPDKSASQLGAEYEDWVLSQINSGVEITGAELGYPEGEFSYPLVTGFFMIKAPSIDAAQAVAATCPHLKYGGQVEVRNLVQH